jgi:hypothetical protein
VLAGFSWLAVKRETRRKILPTLQADANVCCPRNGKQVHGSPCDPRTTPLCSMHGKATRNHLLARIPARIGGSLVLLLSCACGEAGAMFETESSYVPSFSGSGSPACFSMLACLVFPFLLVFHIRTIHPTADATPGFCCWYSL